jgi:Tfp pilus assembly protein PilF
MNGGRRRRIVASAMASALALAGCAMPPMDAGLEPPREQRPAAGESYLALGSRLLAQNEPALAMKAFNVSLSAEGISAEAMTGAGVAAARQGLLTTARRYFENARDLAPGSATAHNNLGVVLFWLRDYDAAAAAFRSALALPGGDSEAVRRNLARTEAALARLEEEGGDESAISQRVVRLGTSAFLLTEASPAEAAAAPEAPDAAGAATEAE